MREILCAEQPCILCAQLLEIVTVYRDDDTDEEVIDRQRLEHSEQDCLTFARLYAETWPRHLRSVPRSGHPAMKEERTTAVIHSGDGLGLW